MCSSILEKEVQMSRLFLIRHGRTVVDSMVEEMHRDPLYESFLDLLKDEAATNKRRIIAGILHRKYHPYCNIDELGLAPEGYRQIGQLHQALVGMRARFSRTWCSPVLRARSTLERLVESGPPFSGARVAYDSRLVERQRGYEAGKFVDLQLFLALNQDEFKRKSNSISMEYRPPGGESLLDVQFRAKVVLEEIRPALRGGDVALVTHHCVINALCGHIEGWSDSHCLERLANDKPPNCGFVVYGLADAGMHLVQRSW